MVAGLRFDCFSMPPAGRGRRVVTLLGLFGLLDHAEQRPYELSGGDR